jgi:hypothetical protein
LIHPYFHFVDLGRWLYGAVATYDPVTLAFSAKPAEGLGEALGQRVRDQFRSLKLDMLYKDIASDIVANAISAIRPGRDHFNLDDARAHLREESERAFGVGPNYLRGVVYEALAVDDKFICDALGL